MKRHIPRRIAPRLSSGDSREPLAHGIPDHIKDALKMIAASRNESVSWMLEQALIEYFGYKSPEYIVRKEEKKKGGKVIDAAEAIERRLISETPAESARQIKRHIKAAS